MRKAKGVLPPDEYILYDEDVYNLPGKPVEDELSIDQKLLNTFSKVDSHEFDDERRFTS